MRYNVEMPASSSCGNLPNRTLFIGDNLPIMRGMESGSVDLIYLDPPFNSNRRYVAPMDSKVAGQRFKDTWVMDDTKEDEHLLLISGHQPIYDLISALAKVNKESWKAYLVYMAARLAEMRRILRPGGSIYCHCDPTMSHGLKLLMDAIFGIKNFRNEIVWSYHRFSRQSGRSFARMHDVILFYTAGSGGVYNHLFVDKRDSDPSIQKGFVVRRKDKKVLVYDREKFNRAADELGVDGYRILDHSGGKVKMGTVWDIPFIHSLSKERVGWKTQKPLALLERIILASSNKGDVVFDPFCGCATACVAAERLDRRWIGIDLSPELRKAMHDRMVGPRSLGEDFAESWNKTRFVEIRGESDLPRRDDVEEIDKKRHKPFLYKKQKALCNGCRRRLEITEMEIDRITPGVRGGRYTADNVQLLCGRCNRRKRGGSMSELLQKNAEETALHLYEWMRRDVFERDSDSE